MENIFNVSYRKTVWVGGGEKREWAGLNTEEEGIARAMCVQSGDEISDILRIFALR